MSLKQINKGATITVVILVLLFLVADHFWYKPMKADEQRREDARHEHCMSTLAEIRAEGGDVVAELRAGRLQACDFGTVAFR